MKALRILGEMGVFILAAFSCAAVALFLGVLVSGCAPVKPQPVAQPPAPVAEVSAPVPAPIVYQPVFEPSPPVPRPARISRRIEILGPGGKTIDYEPGKKYVVTCTEFGTATIKFPAGEKILKFGNRANGEWPIEQANTGTDLPIGALTITRTPYAPTTELHVITDASEVYQFILKPISGGVSKDQSSLWVVRNAETEMRRAQNQEAHMAAMEREYQERRVTEPVLDPEHRRYYEIGGDHVQWAPVEVKGDDKRTVIRLPANTGADLPTLTIIEYGKEMRVNSRALPEEGDKGPRIVVDQPFTEARLIGSGGTVSIVGRTQ